MRGSPITKPDMIRMWNLYHDKSCNKETIALMMNISPMTVYRAITIMEAQVSGKDTLNIFGMNSQNKMKMYAKEIFPTKPCIKNQDNRAVILPNNYDTVCLTKEQLKVVSDNLDNLYRILKESLNLLEQWHIIVSKQ